MDPSAQTGTLPVGEGTGFETWAALHQAYNAVSGKVELALLSLPQRITLLQLYLLVILDKGGGALPVGQIGGQMLRASPTMTGLVDRAEICGWVKRGYDRADRRTTVVAITAAGKAKLQEAWPVVSMALEGICRASAMSRESLVILQMACQALYGTQPEGQQAMPDTFRADSEGRR